MFGVSGIGQKELDCLPVGVALPLREAILYCRCNPPTHWSEQEYNLIGKSTSSGLTERVIFIMIGVNSGIVQFRR